MAVTKLSNLGEITSNFLLNDFDVYIMNTSATGGYASTDWALLGFTSAEKTLERINEKFRREAKIPRVEVFSKTIRKGLNVQFGLDNRNSDFTPIFTQGTKTSLGGTGTRIAHGTDEPAIEYRAIRFATTLESGEIYSITIPKAEITQNGEETIGGEENTVTPLQVKAIFNPSESATASLYYELFLTSAVNATNDVPPGYV